MHIVHTRIGTADLPQRKNAKNLDEINRKSGTCGELDAAKAWSATHIPHDETICTQYDNGDKGEPKVGLSRAAQRIGFALWVIAHGASARHPSPSVTGSH
jgi:hypothetical protein